MSEMTMAAPLRTSAAAGDEPTLQRWGARAAVAAPLVGVFAIAAGIPIFTEDMREVAGSARWALATGGALAVLILLAVLTAAAAVSLRGAAASARVEDVAEQLVAFDRSTRDLARRQNRTPGLSFDLNRGTVRRTDGARDPVPLGLPGGARVSRVIVRGLDSGSGEVPVGYSSLGQTPTDAVRLAGPAGERWVVFAGLTGQAMVLQDEREVEHILAAAAPVGPDAR